MIRRLKGKWEEQEAGVDKQKQASVYSGCPRIIKDFGDVSSRAASLLCWCLEKDVEKWGVRSLLG